MNAWSRSNVEEVISVLWLLAAILCFGFGFNLSGGCLLIKAIFDSVASLIYAAAEIKRNRGVK